MKNFKKEQDMAQLIKAKIVNLTPFLKQLGKEIGDVIEIEPIRYEKDTVLVREGKRINKETGKESVWLPKVVAKKGTIKDYVLHINGQQWSNSNFPSFDKFLKKL